MAGLRPGAQPKLFFLKKLLIKSMEAPRLQGKKIFLLYNDTVNKENLLNHLKKIFFINQIKYILFGKDIFGLFAFVCLENKINIKSTSILNFDGNEGKYRVSTDTSNDILKILNTREVCVEGECDHPIYLLHQIKEKEKENEELKNNYEGKLQRQELEISLKLKESEKEKEELKNKINLLNEKLQNLELINNNLNKSYERIQLHNENFIKTFTEIQNNFQNKKEITTKSQEEISKILENFEEENQIKIYETNSLGKYIYNLDSSDVEMIGIFDNINI